MIICMDTETTGRDLYHGVKPFIVTIADEDLVNHWFEWFVDPITREPIVDRKDRIKIQSWIKRAKKIVMHNSVFDVKALRNIGIHVPWHKIEDTQISAHLVNSLHPKALTAQAAIHLGVDVQKFEDAIKESTQSARGMCTYGHPDFSIAKRGNPLTPSAKDDVWKFDMWLPRWMYLKEGKGDPCWETDCIEYANADTVTTMALWKQHQAYIEANSDWKKIYPVRMELPRLVDKMQSRGLTFSIARVEELDAEYDQQIEDSEERMQLVASSFDYDIDFPNGALNNSIREFAFNVMKLPVVARTDTGNPSLGAKTALPIYDTMFEPNSRENLWIKAYSKRTKAKTKKGYLRSYLNFGQPCGHDGFQILHPSFNPVGTKTIRWTSNNPNGQQIDKVLKYIFGAVPGREYWALDYNNLELRIPAYQCKEPSMLELFEKPDEGPYFGSYHLLTFHMIHPEMWAKHGAECKNHYKGKNGDWYTKIKMGNFADQYGSVDSTDKFTGKLGTADRNYGKAGAQALLTAKLPKRAKLNKDAIAEAQANGFVYTLPDTKYGIENGYPLWCEKNRWGKVKPTVPLNYKTQGTAGWMITMAMIDIDEWFRQEGLDDDYFMIANIHDELVFDFPYKPNRGNQWIIDKVESMMAAVGERSGPTKLTVGVDYHGQGNLRDAI